MLKTFNIVLLLALLIPASLIADYKLIWSEEFDRNTIATDTWTAEENPGVVYNAHEKQFYTDRKENCFIKGGKLVNDPPVDADNALENQFLALPPRGHPGRCHYLL